MSWISTLSTLSCTTLEQLSQITQTSESNAQTATRAVGRASAAAYNAWVAMMAHQSPGTLHRHVKPRDHVTSELLSSGGPTKQPFEIMDAKAQRWDQTWKHGATQQDIIAALHSAKIDAALAELPAIPVSQIKSITRRLSDRTGRAFDNIGPSDIRALPRPALSWLRDIFLEIERECQWPRQLMVNLICLKPKPTSGDRGVALIPWLIRLWTQLRDAPTREWTREHAGFWDQAVEGSSALKVALGRLVDDVVAQMLGIHTGCLFTDIKEFYDYLCPVKTFKAALDLGFPSPIAVLSFFAIWRCADFAGTRRLFVTSPSCEGHHHRRQELQQFLPGPHSTIC